MRIEGVSLYSAGEDDISLKLIADGQVVKEDYFTTGIRGTLITPGWTPIECKSFLVEWASVDVFGHQVNVTVDGKVQKIILNNPASAAIIKPSAEVQNQKWLLYGGIAAIILVILLIGKK